MMSRPPRRSRQLSTPLARRGRAALRPSAEGLEDRLLLASGDLDTAFNRTGVAQVAVSGFSFQGQAIAVQIDGKILVAGRQSTSVTNGTMAVARLNADGTLDTTFGGGVVTIPFPNLTTSLKSFSQATSLAIDIEGRIVVAGSAEVHRPDLTNSADFAAARLTKTGQLDVTFGSQGLRTVSFDLGTSSDEDVAESVAIQKDGMIVMAGVATGASGSGGDQFAVTRLTASGQIDANFGSNGRRTIAFDRGGFKTDHAYAVAVQPDDQKIVVSGVVEDTPSFDLGVARLTTSGTLDATFNANGKQVVNFGSGHEYFQGAYGLAIQPGTRTILVGGGDARADLARLTPSGALDTSFDGDGRLTIAPPAGQASISLTGLALQPDNKIIVGGQAGAAFSAGGKFALARLKVDGSLDATFGSSGQKVSAFDSSSSAAVAKGLALQSDNKVLMVGDVYAASTATKVARFLGASDLIVTVPAPGAPSLDPDSDTGVKGDGTTGNSQPVLIGTAGPGLIVDILDPAGSILGTGTATSSGTYSIRLAAPLDLGAHSLRARARDAQGHLSAPGGAATITVANAGIAPTLIVSVHGQFTDVNAIGRTVKELALGLIPGGALIGGALVGYDAYNGLPATGSGRNLDPWQITIGSKIASLMTAYYADGTDGSTAFIESLEVDWDTYGTASDPAKEVAARVNQIVADTSHDGLPWDILFVGYSRGGPFVSQVMSHIDLVNNPRIDYSEAILLDPTASRISGDVFPDSIPAGLNREIDYDDGYAFPGTQIRFKVGGEALNLVLFTNDGNSDNRIAGAEYRYVRPAIEAYVQSSAGKIPVGVIGGYDSSRAHAAIPYWWSGGLDSEIGTPLRADIAEFLKNKDHGQVVRGGELLVNVHADVIRPTSSAPNLKDPINDLVKQVIRVANLALADAKKLAGKLAAEVKDLVNDVNKQAQRAVDDLIAGARAAGAEALAEAQKQGAAIFKQAKKDVDKLNSEAKKTGDNLLKSGKAFAKNSSKELDKAVKGLASIQKASSKSISNAQKEADKKVGAAKQKALDKLDSLKKQGEQELAKGLAKVAATGEKVKAGVEKLGGDISSGVKNAGAKAKATACKYFKC